MTTVSIEHIEVDRSGTARIAGTRSRVINVVLDKRNGITPDQIHVQYPHLSLSQVYAALAYYYDHQAELDSQIEHELREMESLRGNDDQSPRRQALEARLKAQPDREEENA
jgi:uncharacterized protein (DUF433 family)